MGYEPLFGTVEYSTFLADSIDVPLNEFEDALQALQDYEISGDLDSSKLNEPTIQKEELKKQEESNEKKTKIQNQEVTKKGEENPVEAHAKGVLKSLIEHFNYQKVELSFAPLNQKHAPSSFILHSPGALKKDIYLMIVQTTGKNLRLGLWDSSVNSSSSMIPFLIQASKLDVGIILLNPNLNTNEETIDGQTEQVPISGSESSAKHLLSVWNKYSPSKKILFVANGFGCSSVLTLLNQKSTSSISLI